MRARMPSALLGPFSIRAILAIIVGLAGAGCALVLGLDDTHVSSDIATGPDGSSVDGSNEDGGGSAKLTASPTNLVIRRGSSLAVTVTVQRGGAVGGAVVAHIDDLPGNVAAAPVTILESETKGTITITASASATLGSTTAHLRTDDADLPTIDLPLLVADPAGALDITFDADGMVMDAVKGKESTFYSVTTQADGKILAAGVGGTAGWLARRYFDNGTADTVFTAQTASLPTDGDARAIGIDSAGRVIIAGSAVPGPLLQPQLTVIRLLATGAPDTSFATQGVYRMPNADAPSGSGALAIAIGSDDSVVVAGSRKEVTDDESGVVLRLSSKGVRDAAFGTGVVAVKKNRFVGVSIQPEGIVVAGTDTSGSLTSYTLERFDDKGIADKKFGSNGTSAFALGFRADGYVALSSGNLAIVGESSSAADPKYTAGLTTPTGSQIWTRNTAPGTGAAFHGAATTSDGRLVAAGFTPAPQSEARVDRVLGDGGADLSFGDGGTALVDTKAAKDFDVALWAARVQADGRILVGGNRSNTGAVIYRLWP